MAYTVTFDEGVKGWTSFHSYIPDWMGSLNSRFYTVKDGQLYIQNDEQNPVRNNFYGVQYSTVVKLIVSTEPSMIKFVKALSTESNKAFDVAILAYQTDQLDDTVSSTVSVGEFLNKEGKFHAYVRRNEQSGDLTSKASYGLGTVDSFIGSTITLFNQIPDSLIAEGDQLFSESNVLMGNITGYDVLAGTITLDTTPVFSRGLFLYGQKVGRIEGSEIRGYNFELTLTDSTTGRLELFAVNTEVAKSFPS
jgi:hypothetical protein